MNGQIQKPRSSRPAAVTLPQAVEDLAKSHPDTTWASVPKDPDLKTGWRHITYHELSRAVDGMARWVESQLGIGHGDELVAYMGVNDVRYGVVEIALIKAGYKALLPSPRNSPEGQVSLAATTGCKTLLHSEGIDSFVDIFSKAWHGLRTLKIPSFHELLQQGLHSQRFPSYHDDDEFATVLVLHTSGSTGLPKPIYINNGGLAIHKTMQQHEISDGRGRTINVFGASDKSLLSVAPFFHAMGAITLGLSVLCRRPLVLLPPEKPPNAQLIIEVLQLARPHDAILPPSILEQIADTVDGLQALGTLEHAFFGGAPLATEAGNKASEVTNVVPVIGSTECGLIPSLLHQDKSAWPYFEWAPEAGVEMQPEENGLAELVLKPIAKYKYCQGVFFTFADLEEWRTKDIWQPHPSKPNLWKYVGRKDDVLVLSNGEKHNPVGFEKTLEGSALIAGALVVGQARFQTAMIIEPAWQNLANNDLDALLDQLWPQIEKANADVPSHGRVWRSKVAFARKDKPFKRTPKGSVVRSQTVRLYEPEIEALYSNEGSDEQLGKLDPDADLETTKKFLRQVFKIKGLPIPDDAPDTAEIFSYGIDSLGVLALSSTLNHARGEGGTEAISPRDIYQYPTIESMAEHIQGRTSQGGSRQEAMAKILEKYTQDLPLQRRTSLPPPPEKHTVVLTGSTGSLGNSILEDLIASPSVTQVYCLNRSADAEPRQRSTFEARGAAPDFSKVTFLHTDFGKDKFGLPEEQYNRLLQDVTIFIHNAWAVDFNKSLQSYESVHIAGTRRCADFSHQSKHGAHVVFISSIASVGNWRAKHDRRSTVPEVSFEDHDLPLPSGYGESKHVASLILAHAAKKSGVPTTIIRAGQLAGPRERGQIWNKHEWLPTIVLSSKAIGYLPAELGNQDLVDWVPIDDAGGSVLDIALARSSQAYETSDAKLATAHLVNPQTTLWSRLAPSVLECLRKETDRDIQTVPFSEWLQRMEAIPQTTEEAERVPGLKLLDFYRALVPSTGGLPGMATAETAKLSSTVANMKPVDVMVMKKWVAQWL